MYYEDSIPHKAEVGPEPEEEAPEARAMHDLTLDELIRREREILTEPSGEEIEDTMNLGEDPDWMAEADSDENS